MAETRLPTVPSDQNDLKHECLRLKSSGWSLREIKAWLEKTGEVRAISTISEWIREASIEKFQVEGYADLTVQKVSGMSELDELYREVKKMLKDKVISYKVPDPTKENPERFKMVYKEVSPMVMAQLYNTLESIVDKKNAIRGLTAKSVLNLNQYNTEIHATEKELAEEFGKTNPELLQRFRTIFSKPGQVGGDNGTVVIDGEGEIESFSA